MNKIHHIDSFELEASDDVRETMQRLIDKGLTLRTMIGPDYVSFTLNGTEPAIVKTDADIAHQISITMRKDYGYIYSWMAYPVGKIWPVLHGEAPTLAQAAQECFAAGTEMQDKGNDA